MTITQARKGLQAVLLAAGFALTAGCASNGQIEQAQSEAQDALRAAEAAQRTADEALEAARRAQQSADSAERCCQDNRRELERALERMQQK